MDFGLFFQLPCASNQLVSNRYSETIQQAQLADNLGFSTVWLAELHFNPRFSVMPAPLLVGSAIAQITSKINIGTAVNLLPLHHPIRLAEETATLDVISNGRAVFGIGRGSIPTHFEGYSIPISQSRDRFIESLEIILRAWTEEELTFEGDYYGTTNLRVVPKPYQIPHPPVYIAANSPETFKLVGKLGHNILATPLIATTKGVMNGLKTYRTQFSDISVGTSGGKIAINLPVYVDKNRDKAKNDVRQTMKNYIDALNEMRDSSAREREAQVLAKDVTRRDRSDLTPDRIIQEYAAVGDPEECIETIEKFKETFGPQEIMCWFNIGGLLPHEDVVRSMTLFAEKVAPYFE